VSGVRRVRAPDAPLVALALVTLVGCSAVLLAAGVGAEDRALALGGAAGVGAGLFLLVLADWISGPALVLLSLPLPAIYSAGDLRIAAAAPVTAAVVLAWMFRLGVSRRPVAIGVLPVAAALLLMAALLLTTITAQSVPDSVRELANFGLLMCFLVVATDELAHDRERLRATIGLAVAIGAATGVLAVLEMVGVIPGEFPRYDTAFNRAALGFGQPNALGLFLAVLVPLGVHQRAMAKDLAERLAANAALVLIALGLVASFSRGAWLAVLGGAFALLLTGERRFVLRIWLGTLVLAFAVDVVTGGAIRDTVTRSIGDWVIEQRAALMLAGVLMFLAHPVVGVGPGGYAVSLERFGAQIPQLWDYLHTPHNAYVQMAAEAGIIGLIAFLVFLGASLLVQIRRVRLDRTDPAVPAGDASLRRALLWSFAVACAACMVVWPFSHGTGQAVMLIAAAGFASRRW
jgi:O-antigen ligase